jgi:hypothetical protein
MVGELTLTSFPITAGTNDARCNRSASTWASVVAGTAVFGHDSGVDADPWLARTLSGATYYNGVVLLRFDTSSLPDDAVITSATLELYVFDLANPEGLNLIGDYYDYGGGVPDTGDWVDLDQATVNAVNTSTAGFVKNTVASVPLLNPTLISRTGFTGIRLGFARKAANAAPTQDNYFQPAGFEDPTNVEPTLKVTWDVPVTITVAPPQGGLNLGGYAPVDPNGCAFPVDPICGLPVSGQVICGAWGVCVPEPKLQFDGRDPTLLQSVDQVIATPQAVLQLDGRDPTFAQTAVLAPPQGVLQFDGLDPAISIVQTGLVTISPDQAILQFKGYAPTVVYNGGVTVPQAVLQLLGYAPVASTTAVVATPQGVLQFKGYAPVFAIDGLVTLTQLGQLLLAGQAPGFAFSQILASPEALLRLLGYTPGFIGMTRLLPVDCIDLELQLLGEPLWFYPEPVVPATVVLEPVECE